MKIRGTKTGFLSCRNKEARQSDLSEYGVGIVLYFQFLKYLAALFLLLTILSLPSFLCFSFGTTPGTPLMSKFTLGNLGQSSKSCNYAPFSSGNEGSYGYQSNIQLSCPFGTLHSISVLGQQQIDTRPQCLAHTKPETDD